MDIVKGDNNKKATGKGESTDQDTNPRTGMAEAVDGGSSANPQDPKLLFHLKALEQENAELREIVMAQHKSADLKMRCVEAVVKTDMHKGIDFIINAAETIFKYVSGQE